MKLKGGQVTDRKRQALEEAVGTQKAGSSQEKEEA